jgi:hypothetical protein
MTGTQLAAILGAAAAILASVANIIRSVYHSRQIKDLQTVTRDIIKRTTLK